MPEPIIAVTTEEGLALATLGASTARGAPDGPETMLLYRPIEDLRGTVRRKVSTVEAAGGRIAKAYMLPGEEYALRLAGGGAVFCPTIGSRGMGLNPGEFDFVCPYVDVGHTYLDGDVWRIDVMHGLARARSQAHDIPVRVISVVIARGEDLQWVLEVEIREDSGG